MLDENELQLLLFEPVAVAAAFDRSRNDDDDDGDMDLTLMLSWLLLRMVSMSAKTRLDDERIVC